jgi:hypothetical protein
LGGSGGEYAYVADYLGLRIIDISPGCPSGRLYEHPDMFDIA